MSNTIYMTNMASYLPENVIYNDNLAKIVDTSDEWISSRTGIKQRHICGEDQDSSDLAVMAAKKLVDCGMDPENIDAIVVATTTSNRMPSAACRVQYEIGAKNAFAFDISAACSGFIYGTYVAKSFMSSSGSVKNVLLISSEAMSQFVDWSDRSTCVLFGDGSSAVLFQKSNVCGDNQGCTRLEVIDTMIKSMSDKNMYEAILIDCKKRNNHVLSSDGFGLEKQGDDIEIVLADGDVCTISSNNTFGSRNVLSNEFIVMNGNYVFKNAVDTMSKAINDILSANGLTINDVDWIVPHQANKRIIDAMCKFFDFNINKFVCTVDIHANTSAASIPLAIGHAIDNKFFKKGEVVVTVAFGAGFTYGASIMKVV